MFSPTLSNATFPVGSTPPNAFSGHNALVIPVPPLEDVVRGRWRHHDPGWVSEDPRFMHAHITALSPFLRDPRHDDLRRVADIVTGMRRFEFTLSSVEVFPNGCIHLAPRPAGPFVELTELLTRAFPMCEPYEGEYEPVPHLTLDQRSDSITPEGIRLALGDSIPVTCRAQRLEMHWYEAGNCHVRDTWRFSS